MAFRTWGRVLLTALGVSVLAGAGQLGIAYGFGVVRLGGAFADGTVNRWPAQLAWVGWCAAIAAVAGAVVTERLARRDGFGAAAGEQLAVAGVAALGATVVAPLCMQPARAAELGGTVDPVWAVGICAILGALVGAGASIAVLLKSPFGWNIALTAAAGWLLALVSVTPTVASSGPLLTVRLGVFEPSWVDAGTAQRLAMIVLPALALLAGAATGVLARRRGHPPLVGGASGVAGPVLLAFAYLTAGPGAASDRYQLAPYYGALIAVAAGALGSALATVLPRPAAGAGSDAIEPTDILQPLPPVPATPGAPATDDAADPAGVPVTGTPAARPVAVTDAAAGRFDDPAGRRTPAHWDWPEPAGLTPAGAGRPDALAGATPDEPTGQVTAEPTGQVTAEPTGQVRTEPSSQLMAEPTGRVTVEPSGYLPDEATRAGSAAPEPAGTGGVEPDGSAAGRDLSPELPRPGLLPSGRRTSAIDVLAAGRSSAHRSVETADQSPAAPDADRPADLPPPPDLAAPATREPADPEHARPKQARPEQVSVTQAGLEQGGSEPVTAAPAAPEPTRPDTVDAVPEPTRPATVDAAPEPTRPATVDAAPEPTHPATVDAAPEPTHPATVDAAPPASEPAHPERVTAAPAVPESATRRPTSGRKPATTRRATAQPATARAAGPEPAGALTTPPAEADSPADRSDRTAGVPPVGQPPATGERNEPRLPAAGEPATVPDPAETGTRPGGRPRRTRKGRAGTEPVRASASPAPVSDVPAGPAVPASDDRPEDVPVAGGPAVGAEPGPDADGRPGRTFFFDPEPPRADPPASPRPRFPIFEDVVDQPGTVRPAWPIAPATNWPVTPRTAGAAGSGGTDGDGGAADDAPAGAYPGTPTPRPRHRALPDLGRGLDWDAFAPTRPATPATAEAAGPGSTGDATKTEDAGSAAAATPDRSAPAEPVAPTGAAPSEEQETGGRAKSRRGLFRRNRARTVEVVEPDRDPEILAAQDEEYVDWVAGLASDDNAEDARTLRTGRHHRD
ncbi:hypothetical protein [Micromonospora auratinigra]|uniref:Uncharacterized protein n=1 Tax=Micromonospora auratinigra TaxID=261654 RepID=A0A1A8ZV70_9ACTN|nr:hypothetical protein [Micromonospora auratinigra]SBT47731.1 hypothetical protein GA0070611_3823 [Micromonospora auratinigra]